MQLNHQIIQILHHAIEELGGGKYVFNSQTTYRIARHARKLRDLTQDIESVRLIAAKNLENSKDCPETKIKVEEEWRSFLKEEVEVDVEANLVKQDLNLWDESNKEGNKIPASLLASLEPLLEDKD